MLFFIYIIFVVYTYSHLVLKNRIKHHISVDRGRGKWYIKRILSNKPNLRLGGVATRLGEIEVGWVRAYI